MDLSGANFRRAKLENSDLSQADLSGANLEWADLRWVDLVGANLQGCNLTRADFHKADLHEAFLQNANLTLANFEDANLVSANLTGAIFKSTRILSADLSLAKGLDKTMHIEPSVLDSETLAKSGDLPIEFLRGCGLYSAYRANVYRVVVASPSEVESERKTARDTIYAWNDHNAHQYGGVLLPVLWETHAVPEIGDRPQAIINRQLIETSQILVCIFWSRIGTPTGEAEAGTIEEINKFIEAGKPILIYFCTRDLPQDHDLKQWKRLKKFKDTIKKKGLIFDFKTEEQLTAALSKHLTEIFKNFIKSANCIKICINGDENEYSNLNQ